MAQPTNVRSSVMDPLLTFKFLVSWEIGGALAVVAGVSKVGPLSRTTEVAEYSCADSGPRIPGQTAHEEIHLERGIIIDVAFERWANKAWNYPSTGALGRELSLVDLRKTLKIDLLNQAGQILSSFYIFNCWPSKSTLLPELDALAGDTVALESMTLQSEGWARDPNVNGADLPSFAEPLAPTITGG